MKFDLNIKRKRNDFKLFIVKTKTEPKNHNRNII